MPALAARPAVVRQALALVVAVSSIVAEGQRILDEQRALIAQQAAEEAAEQAQAELEAQALAELRLTAPAILDLLTAVLARLAAAETEIEATKQMCMATRVRRPVRDELGTILYVVDELQPPAWAMPMTSIGPADPNMET